MSETTPRPERSSSEGKLDNQTSHGHSDHGNDGHGHNRGNRNSRNRSNGEPRTKKTKFKGACEPIEDYVYDTGQPTSNQELYSTTTKKIAEYIARTYDGAGEFRNALVNLKFDPLIKPKVVDYATKYDKDNKPIVDEEAREEWKEELKSYKKEVKTREKNSSKAFALILGQCSDMLRSKIESHDDWETTNRDDDPVELLKIIKHCMVHKTTTRHKGYSIIEAEGALNRFRQGEKMTLEDYRDRLISLIDVFRDVGGEPGTSKLMVKEYGSESAALEAYTALRIINQSDPKRFGDLVNELSNQYTRGLDGYPDTVSKAFDMLVNYKPPRRNNNNNQYPKNELSFATVGEEEHGGGRGGGRGRGRGRSNGRGRGYQQRGQVGDNQNNEQVEDYSASARNLNELVETTVSLSQSGSKLHPRMLLMDSCSSVTIISNKELVHGIYKSDQTLRVHCGGGDNYLSYKARFGDYPKDVWFDPDGLANIMSMDEVADMFRLTMDTDAERSINMHKQDGTIIKFKPVTARVYSHMLDVHNHDDNKFWSFIQTVSGQKEYYTKREIEDANNARRFQNIIMRPSARFTADTAIKHLPNCPITRRALAVADDIYGPNLGSIKGKTPHKTIKHVPGNTDPVPPEILKRHRHLTIVTDIMFINKEPFLVTYSRALRFGTVTHLSNRQTKGIKQSLKSTVRMYKNRGFIIDTIFADIEFEDLRKYIPILDTTGANDHVPDAERYIRTIKDRVRSTYRMLPFQYIPRLVLVQLTRNCVFWLNAFPHPDGISNEHSPRYIMTGTQLNYDKHVRCEFGAYAQVDREHSNNMNERAVGGICLGPTGNAQGTHNFLSLSTGKRIKGTVWRGLPMPEDVILRVNQMGKDQGFPKTLTFADRHGNEIPDNIEDFEHWGDEDDEDYQPTDDSSDDEGQWYDDEMSQESDDDQSRTSHEEEDTILDLMGHNTDVPDGDEMSQVSAEDIVDNPGHANQSQDVPVTLEDTNADDPTDTFEADDTVEQTGASDTATQTGANDGDYHSDEEDPQTLQEEFEAAEAEGIKSAGDGSGRPQRNRRPHKDPSFLYNIFESTPQEAFNYLMSQDCEEAYCFLTEQMTAKKGLKRFKEAGAQAIMNELEQIVYRRVMRGKHAHELTREDKRAALRYLMFLKQKRCGKIKARGCADGRKQRLYKTKEETTSPTVSIEGMILTCMVDAYERRHVGTCDIGGAFMHADIDEKIHIKLDGELAHLLIKVDETYAQFLTYENGNPVIYAELSKALYGTLQAAKLFWENLTEFLCKDLGFTVNPYDACVVNKYINGKQCTIAWHVDDLKISHVELEVVKDIIGKLNDKYGKETPLSLTLGDVHEYLGMTIDFSRPGEVSFIMKDYVTDLIGEKPKSMDGRVATTPAASHLYQINEDADKIDDKDAEIFHHLTAKLLYLAKRSRPDILTAVSFLCTRVKSPDCDDWKKLNRCMNYLEGTQDLYLTVGMNKEPTINWWVDASFAVHPDMRSHTGATVSLGKGSVVNKSSKQKINTRSSTEAEVVGVNDAMTMILWMKLFLDAQGVSTTDNIIHQDNMSSILLEKNGKRSSGKQTRHMDIRYFFITDCVKQGMTKIEYCPTEHMHGDFFTKPLQGSLFRTHRAMILGLDSAIESTSTTSSEWTSGEVEDMIHQERVEPYGVEDKDTYH